MSAAAVELGAPVPLERSSRVEEIKEKEVEDLTEIVDNMKIAETAPDPEKVMKHPLQNAWTLWFFKNDKTRSWEENQRPIITVTTVEDFWSLYNHIEVASRLPRETSWLCGSLTPASRRHHQDRQDDQGEAGHRPRPDYRLQHPQRGEGGGEERQDQEVLRLSSASPRSKHVIRTMPHMPGSVATID